MDQMAYARAVEELNLATAKVEAMKSAPGLAQYAQAWSEFLIHVQRSFTKMRIATKSGPSKGWYDSVEYQRKTDELLSYIKHARNAEEHGIDPITIQKESAIGIGPKVGNYLYIDHLEIGNGQILLGPEVAKNARIEFIPACVHLRSVRDRGISYDPPKTHLGENLKDSRNPLEIAEITLGFLNGIITHANDHFR